MKNMQNHYVNGIDARSLMAKIPLFMKLCSFLLLINVSVAFASASNSRISLSSESIMQSGITVTGTVVDTEGLTMPGVNIIVKGTTTGVITDIDGNFRISVPDKNSVLVFSFVGYTAQDIVVGNQTNIKVTLQADALELEDVVVVGYGVQKKKLVTGATSQVKGEDITKLNTVNALGALASQTPGVNITSVSGMPGEGFKVAVRGLGTVGNSEPLYIIDGVTGGDINSLNPADIESIDILKDAASAAIYGARAANGVVLVTTKQGRTGKLDITLDTYVVWQNIINSCQLWKKRKNEIKY